MTPDAPPPDVHHDPDARRFHTRVNGHEAELLAARLQGEPLPIDARLAKALGTERLP